VKSELVPKLADHPFEPFTLFAIRQKGFEF
jgi:hypothetical protein